MKTVITGASGFLGKTLIQKLEQKKTYPVLALTSRTEELKSGCSRNIEVLDKNIIFEDSCREVFGDSVIVNCAFPRNTNGAQMADGLKYIQTVFEKASAYKAKALINISSQSVYPASRNEAADEAYALSLDTAYAVGKYATELMTEAYFEGSTTVYTNIRMASLIGPGFDQRIVNRLVKRGFEEKSIQVFKNDQIFGFLDIDDAAEALIALMDTAPEKWKRLYNIGISKGYRVTDIADAVRRVLLDDYGLDITVVTEENDNALNTTVNMDRFSSDTGFRPETDLYASVKRIAKRYMPV